MDRFKHLFDADVSHCNTSIKNVTKRTLQDENRRVARSNSLLDSADRVNSWSQWLHYKSHRGKLPMSKRQFDKYRQMLNTQDFDYWFVDNDRDIMAQTYCRCHPSDLETLKIHYKVCKGEIPYSDVCEGIDD